LRVQHVALLKASDVFNAGQGNVGLDNFDEVNVGRENFDQAMPARKL
jgi:hypothetical protein